MKTILVYFEYGWILMGYIMSFYFLVWLPNLSAVSFCRLLSQTLGFPYKNCISLEPKCYNISVAVDRRFLYDFNGFSVSNQRNNNRHD